MRLSACLHILILLLHGIVLSLKQEKIVHCELEALKIGTRLSDIYNGPIEEEEWDIRVHQESLMEHLGFAPWMANGVYKSGGKTPKGIPTSILRERGGWAGLTNVSESPYWGLADSWLYLMGDSTTRQLWGAFATPFNGNNFERNAKQWSRENCDRQYPHRKRHEPPGPFPEEGWGGKCGNNEVTCNIPGFGKNGIISYDWKHFPYEDYDEWLWGENGMWTNNATQQRPSIVSISTGLHTCFHALPPQNGKEANWTMIKNHQQDLRKLMVAINKALNRTKDLPTPQTIVIFTTAGRIHSAPHDPVMDDCIFRFNRIMAKEAHDAGFPVFEREEIERRLLFRSEHFEDFRTIKPHLHLDAPAPAILATSMLSLISCLKGGTLHTPPWRLHEKMC